jgi:hypothetical protein
LPQQSEGMRATSAPVDARAVAAAPAPDLPQAASADTAALMPQATAAAPVTAAAPAQPAAPGPLPGVVVTPNGNLYKLNILPWGVVYVDDVDRGVSPPVKRLTLTPGRHAIRVTNPNFHDRVLEVDTASGDGQITVDFNAEPR